MAIEEINNSGLEASDYDSKDKIKIKSRSDSSASSTEDRRGIVKNVDCAFDTTEDPRFYKPIESYEGYHRWDPEFEWTEAEEKAVVRKLDRGNVVQATSDNMLGDLGMTTNNYNTGQTIFLVTFLFAELPSQLISKWVGPDRWIPVQMVSWSLIAACQAFVKDKSSYYACRALLGLLEGGFIPDTILFLSFWYKTAELPIRLSYFWMAYQLTSIVSAFLAYGFLHIHNSDGTGGWRYMFAFEGLITGVIGVIAGFWMPASPTQTAGRFRGKEGWFNEHEEKIMVNRILRDDPSKGGMHNRQPVTPKMLWAALKDYDMWIVYLLGLTWMIPSIPSASYISLELKSLGFSTFHTNLLTIPAYVIFILNLLWITWVSERFNQRFLLGIVAQFWALILLIALEVLPNDASAWVRWILIVLLIAMPYVHAIIVAIASRNAGTVRTRTVATALYNMSVQASNIIGNNVYQASDKPYYRTGNAVLIALCVWSALLFIAAKLYYVRRNKQNAAIWDNMSSEERERYVVENAHLGNKRVDFRFVH
ncbi:hypothetical protein N7490_009239 [Penicillium lividum]|nr:hypothetical protein N7490_009239 [Penicillium lividum]